MTNIKILMSEHRCFLNIDVISLFLS